jgi:hypothetical protein
MARGAGLAAALTVGHLAQKDEEAHPPEVLLEACSDPAVVWQVSQERPELLPQARRAAHHLVREEPFAAPEESPKEQKSWERELRAWEQARLKELWTRRERKFAARLEPKEPAAESEPEQRALVQARLRELWMQREQAQRERAQVVLRLRALAERAVAAQLREALALMLTEQARAQRGECAQLWQPLRELPFPFGPQLPQPLQLRPVR